jgi:hypothetical protein
MASLQSAHSVFFTRLQRTKRMDCAICLGPLEADEEQIQLKCHETHCFHRECLLGWALTQTRPSCPLCRARIGSELDLSCTGKEKLRALLHVWTKPIRGGLWLGSETYLFIMTWVDLGWQFPLIHIPLVKIIPVSEHPNHLWRWARWSVRMTVGVALLSWMGFDYGLQVAARASLHRLLAAGVQQLLKRHQLISLSKREQAYTYRYEDALGWRGKVVRVGAMFMTTWAMLEVLPRIAGIIEHHIRL